LLRLIGFFTNLFYYGRLSTTLASPAGNHLGWFPVLIPVAGSLAIGFMARYAGFWPLVNMGAILGEAMRAPFTAILFALELTHDINVLLPLLALFHCFSSPRAEESMVSMISKFPSWQANS